MPRKDAFARWQARLASRAVRQLWQTAQRVGTITADTPAAREFAGFGAGSLIAFPTGALFGQAWIEIGSQTMVGAQVSLSAGMVPGHDLGDSPVLRIGDRCVVGMGSHVVAHHSIVIGDDVYTGPYVYITDQNHGYTDPDTPIGRQWPTNSAVSIGAGSWLGTGVVILPGAVIGRNVVVAAGSVVRGEVPDRCVVAGVPAKVVREYVPGLGWTRDSRGLLTAPDVAKLPGNAARVCHDGGTASSAVAVTGTERTRGKEGPRRQRGVPA